MSEHGRTGNVRPHPPSAARSVLITGAGGYLGRLLVADLAGDRAGIQRIVAADVRVAPAVDRLEGVVYAHADVRGDNVAALLAEHGVDTVVHLAAIVTPPKGAARDFLHSVDVAGTENVVNACLVTGVRKFIVTSSGAAYGYYADNPDPLREDDSLRGNPEFAYSDHKRLVEEFLARTRREHPELEQLVFRPGAILGDTVHNQITDLFEKRFVLGVAGSDAPFCFIWDRDVVACLRKGILENVTGTYNLVGDGRTTMPEIARRLGRRYVPIPAAALRGALWALHGVRLTQYGPEQVDFLRYRPVLANDLLKTEFGYVPRRTSTEVFEAWRIAHATPAHP